MLSVHIRLSYCCCLRYFCVETLVWSLCITVLCLFLWNIFNCGKHSCLVFRYLTVSCCFWWNTFNCGKHSVWYWGTSLSHDFFIFFAKCVDLQKMLLLGTQVSQCLVFFFSSAEYVYLWETLLPGVWSFGTHTHHPRVVQPPSVSWTGHLVVRLFLLFVDCCPWES